MEEDDLIDIPFDVWPEEHNRRVDLFLSRRIKRMSRSKAAALIKMGVVSKSGEGVIDRPSTHVHHGDRILLKRKKLEEPPTDPLTIITPDRIVYTEHWLRKHGYRPRQVWRPE